MDLLELWHFVHQKCHVGGSLVSQQPEEQFVGVAVRAQLTGLAHPLDPFSLTLPGHRPIVAHGLAYSTGLRAIFTAHGVEKATAQ